jgi:arylsulfatase A-like enzyme
VFDSAYAQAPWTLPSHTAMLTGKYPWDLNMWVRTDILPKSALTIAEEMQGYGYQTAAFSDGPFVNPAWGFDQGFDEFHGSVQEQDWKDVPKIFNDATTWTQTRTSKQPFFLFVHTFEVHDPYGGDAPGSVHIKDIISANRRADGASSDVTNHFIDEYHKEIRKTDAALKDFFAELTQQGLLKKTIVIITSDHGEEFGEHGTVALHSITVYRELLHVPLIVIHPRIHTEQRIARSVELRSIPATILELTGLQKNYSIAPSLAPALSGIDLGDAVVRAATSQYRTMLLNDLKDGYGAVKALPTPRPGPYTGPKITTALQSRVHAIKQIDGSIELYDMQTDSGEKVNAYDQTLIQNATPTVKNVLRALDEPYD